MNSVRKPKFRMHDSADMFFALRHKRRDLFDKEVDRINPENRLLKPLITAVDRGDWLAAESIAVEMFMRPKKSTTQQAYEEAPRYVQS